MFKIKFLYTQRDTNHKKRSFNGKDNQLTQNKIINHINKFYKKK